MKITIINKSDSLGGAAIVMHRLMDALRDKGADARMLVLEKDSDSPYIEAVSNRWSNTLRLTIERLPLYAGNGFDRDKLFLVDDGKRGLNLSRHPWVTEADVIVLGWVNQTLLSLKGVEQLCRLGKPVYWVMHDMWNCTGICHHAHSCDKYRDRCYACEQINSKRNSDLSTRVQQAKRELYDACHISFVAVSNWLADCCRRSALMRDATISTIANAFPIARYDWHFEQAEHLPYDKIIVAMGAARLDDSIKGFDTLIALSKHLSEYYPKLATKLHLLLFGAINDQSLLAKLTLPYTYVGYRTDATELYRHCHIVLSTSRYESFGATLVEGIASGCLAVATANGGQSDIIEHRRTGFLATDVDTLAQGLQWAAEQATITREELHRAMEERFDASKIADQWLNLINKDMNNNEQSSKKKIVIAIDGYSSTGKSTMAKALAKRVGYAYVDTGAMYRAVTLYSLRHGIIAPDGTVDTAALEQALPNIKITFSVDPATGKSITCLDGKAVEREIRSMEVSSHVSTIAAIAAVRHAMVAQQQAMGADKGIVMDGRDIGTVVFPNAEMKVFVTASALTRAQRRYDELRAKGDTTTTLEEVIANVEQRDRLDTTRAESPLRQAPDAVLLDNSDMTIDEQDQWLLDLFNERVDA